ncbi:MAG: alpha/beta hydrolase [Anaerolineae bacterium]|nr:alpha/beta hydrolase [Anaerolineae bacterium]
MGTRFSTSVDGTRIAYDVTGSGRGSGPALMLLHGAGNTRRDWHEVGYVERLQDDFTVITVDIRGTGDSDCLYAIVDYGIEKICEDLYVVADDCGASEFAVWGFSFGGNIARYLGAWSDRVTAIAVIGVPFGPAVHADFDRHIDRFVKKWGALAEAYHRGELSKPRKPFIWWACFQAMWRWPSVEPGDVNCPAMLLVGTKNGSVLDWVNANREALDKACTRVEIVEGLNHPQEFSEIDRVFPVVSSFFKNQRG